MPAKIRLQRHGKKGKPFYHIVTADVRAPRDGKYIERIGSYNPNTNPATVMLDVDRAVYWLQNGAQPTDTARSILSYKGAMYKHHLLKGVKKGAFDEAEMERRFNAWLTEKESKIQGKIESLAKADEAAVAKIFAAEKEINEKRAQELAAAASPMIEEAPAEEAPVAEAPVVEEVKEEAPVAEAPVVEEVKEEAPKGDVKPDDLKKIEGIGPKIASTLNEAGVITFAELAATSTEKISEIIAGVRGNHVPDTWPKQAEMAAEGKWDELKKWQDELDGGKPKA